MKIINKKKFLSLPEGILYSEYEPCILYGLKVKGETWERDYLETDIIDSLEAKSSIDHTEKLMEAQQNGISLHLDFENNTSRNGLFEDDTLYAVYEKEDLNKLINFLKTCKGYECTK